jgi:hypothetical protein
VEQPYSLQPYQYAANDPVRLSDPSGRFCLDALTALLCGIGTVAGSTAALLVATPLLAAGTIYLYTGAPNAEANRQNLARGFDFVVKGGQGYVWNDTPPKTHTGNNDPPPPAITNSGEWPQIKRRRKSVPPRRSHR